MKSTASSVIHLVLWIQTSPKCEETAGAAAVVELRVLSSVGKIRTPGDPGRPARPEALGPSASVQQI